MISNPSSSGPKVLLVDDSDLQRSMCAELLAGADYRVLQAADGLEAIEVWAREAPDLILLDVDMPRLNGWRTLERLRGGGCSRPVLMLTGLDQVEDRVRGLTAGADDYLAKPCDGRELLARVQAHLRRGHPAAGRTELFFGDITVDLAAQTAQGPAGPVALTRIEYSLLGLLAGRPGHVVSREALLDRVWGYANRPNTRTVETHIWRLRKKLADGGREPRWIQTAPGGYRLVSDGPAARAA